MSLLYDGFLICRHLPPERPKGPRLLPDDSGWHDSGADESMSSSISGWDDSGSDTPESNSSTDGRLQRPQWQARVPAHRRDDAAGAYSLREGQAGVLSAILRTAAGNLSILPEHHSCRHTSNFLVLTFLAEIRSDGAYDITTHSRGSADVHIYVPDSSTQMPDLPPLDLDWDDPDSASEVGRSNSRSHRCCPTGTLHKRLGHNITASRIAVCQQVVFLAQRGASVHLGLLQTHHVLCIMYTSSGLLTL